jgi:hypothetical protein
VHPLVQPASIAQVLSGFILAPQWSDRCVTVGAAQTAGTGCCHGCRSRGAGGRRGGAGDELDWFGCVGLVERARGERLELEKELLE